MRSFKISKKFIFSKKNNAFVSLSDDDYVVFKLDGTGMDIIELMLINETVSEKFIHRRMQEMHVEYTKEMEAQVSAFLNSLIEAQIIDVFE